MRSNYSAYYMISSSTGGSTTETLAYMVKEGLHTFAIDIKYMYFVL